MEFSSSLQKTSEETFDFICTACAKDDLIKEALKYCVECQEYYCQDCLRSHRRISSIKGHSLLDNSSVKPQGRRRSLPAFPTKQCSKHVGKIMDMLCEDHDVVCCYVCAVEDHKSCKDMVSVSDNIDRLYSKTDTYKATFKLKDVLDDMNHWQTNTDTLLQRLQDSKASAIKAVNDYRVEMEKFLKELEEASIKEIEYEYQKLESQILEEKKSYEDSIDDLKNLKQLLAQASENIAQLFVCTKIAEKKFTTIGDYEKKRKRFRQAEVKFVPSEELKSSIEKMKHLGETSAISSRACNLYEATKIRDINVRLQEDVLEYNCSIYGSCTVDDTVIFTDYMHNKLKRFDVSSLSLIDYCEVPYGPHGICRVGDEQVAVTCEKVIQFVSIGDKLSLSCSITMKHKCWGIAYSNDKLYITDADKSIYMYDMSGNVLNTVTTDNSGQLLFECCRHITYNDKKDRLFVGDRSKGLVRFNDQCDYIETITDSGINDCGGVCVDGYGNVIVANYELQTIVQCGRDGQTRGIIVKKTQGSPQSVCIHHELKKMFVGYWSNTVEVYNLTWKNDLIVGQTQ